MQQAMQERDIVALNLTETHKTVQNIKAQGAFREFSAKNLEKEEKPSIRKELAQARQQAKAQHRQREKVKTKDRGVEL